MSFQPAQRFEVKKYPNRRFYDVTRSRHVTLSDLHELVRAGNEIFVTDSATGNDITNVVLAQIILEHDPPKLDLFPASLLHQAIQANEQMVRKFIEQYFSQAMDAFVKSRQQFDDYLRRVGFSALTPMAPFDWVRMLFPQQGMNPFASPAPPAPPVPNDTPIHAPGAHSMPAREAAGGESADGRIGAASVAGDSLREEVAALRAELASLRSSVRQDGEGARKSSGRKRK